MGIASLLCLCCRSSLFVLGVLDTKGSIHEHEHEHEHHHSMNTTTNSFTNTSMNTITNTFKATSTAHREVCFSRRCHFSAGSPVAGRQCACLQFGSSTSFLPLRRRSLQIIHDSWHVSMGDIIQGKSPTDHMTPTKPSRSEVEIR
jgi:hypothetical protein